MNSKEIISIILNVCLISTFIGIFFFTYAAKVEGEIVSEQVDFLVRDFTDGVLAVAPKSIVRDLRDNVKSSKLPDMSKVDEQAAEANKKLIQLASKVLGGLLVFGIASSLIIWRMNKDTISSSDMLRILKETLVILLMVAITEFVFITYIAKSYITAEPNQIKKRIIEIVQENL